MNEKRVYNWRDLPHGVYEGANRYSTDDEEVLTLWRDGETWDVRADKEVERIKVEAAMRVREAFYTGGHLSQYRRNGIPVEVYDAVFHDVMLALEPLKAEVEARNLAAFPTQPEHEPESVPSSHREEKQ